jgi:hypothetical protein
MPRRDSETSGAPLISAFSRLRIDYVRAVTDGSTSVLKPSSAYTVRNMSGETATENAPGLPSEPQARHVVYCGGADLQRRP